MTSPFPARLRGVPATAVPMTFAMGSSSLALRLLFRVSRIHPRPPPPGDEPPSRGLRPLRDISRWSPQARGVPRLRFVPSSAFRTPSTASSTTDLAGLFHPAATSGVRSPGVSPLAQPYGLVARRCPRVVCACSLPPVARRRQKPAPAFRALLRAESPLSNRGGLAHDPRAPLLSFPSLGFSFACRRNASQRSFRPRPFTALDVLPTRDLTDSCDSAFPVRGFRPALPTPRCVPNEAPNHSARRSASTAERTNDFAGLVPTRSACLRSRLSPIATPRGVSFF
jgi:hypothetical protein